jgi:hypothetical protein
MGNRTNGATTHTWAPRLLPQVKIIARFKHQARGHGDWRGYWWCRSVSWRTNTTSSKRIPIPPLCARSVRSPQPVVDFPEISSQNSNKWHRREWEGQRASPLSWVGSHRKHECEHTLMLGVTPTSPAPLAYRWRCHHHPRSYDLQFPGL